MAHQSPVTDHYSTGALLDAIREGLASMGLTPQTVSVDDLAPVDEFHVGGRSATAELCAHLDATPDAQLLDIGCGIGGTARFIASTIGCEVTGIDLTSEYIDVARILTGWTSLDDRVRFEVASALDTPFEDATFDGATQLHVGMNIADKASLFREVHRVLRPGSRFALYDIMRSTDDDITYPVPWATDASHSHLSDLPTYLGHLVAAGFDVVTHRNRATFAAEFFAAMRSRSMDAGGPPPLGLHVIMGSDASTKIANMVSAIGAGTIAPIEVICQRSS